MLIGKSRLLVLAMKQTRVVFKPWTSTWIVCLHFLGDPLPFHFGHSKHLCAFRFKKELKKRKLKESDYTLTSEAGFYQSVDVEIQASKLFRDGVNVFFLVFIPDCYVKRSAYLSDPEILIMH